MRIYPGRVRRPGELTNPDVAAGKAPSGEFFHHNPLSLSRRVD